MSTAVSTLSRGASGVPVTRIRPAQLERDRDFIVAAVRTHLNPAADGERFDWLYRRNPHGQGRAWIAVDANSEAPIGLAAAFPRELYVGGRRQLGWVLGDFCVAEGYRTLGPALALQRACLAGIGDRTVCYDLPGPAMMPIYRRLGVSVSGRLTRFAKPLRMDGRIQNPLVPALLSGILVRGGNRLLALADGGRGTPRGLRIGPEHGPCGEEFTELADELGRRHGFCLRRSAAYLNWRFVTAPHKAYELLTARRDGRLCGYVITERAGNVGWVVDLFAANDDTVPRALVMAAVTRFRHEGVVTAAVALVETHPWTRQVMGLGFRPRESCPIVLSGLDVGRRPDDAGRWLVVHGDRES